MCMMFGCNLQIHFCHFFCSSDLVIFWLKAFRQWVSCEGISYILKMCMKKFNDENISFISLQHFQIAIFDSS